MKRNRKAIILSIVITAVVMMIAAGSLVFFVLMPKTNELKKQLDNYQTIVGDNLHSVYVSAKSLNAGDVLNAEDVYVTSVYLTNPENVINDNDIGKTLLIDIPENEIVYQYNLVHEIPTETERRVEYSCFTISKGMTAGSYIDVRIRFQNREDYAILTHKMISELNEDNHSCFLTVDENEIRRMASAIVDANVYEGHIYATAYTLGVAQSATEVTYLPSYSDPDFKESYFTNEMVEARDAMVRRLIDYAEHKVTYTSGIDIRDLSKPLESDVSDTYGSGSESDKNKK